MLAKLLNRSIPNALAFIPSRSIGIFKGVMHHEPFDPKEEMKPEKFSTEIEMMDPEVSGKMRQFRLMDFEGNCLNKKLVDTIDHPLMIKMFEHMLQQEEHCKFFLTSQRTGKIPFYLPSTGEQAVGTGMGPALKFEDFILPHYREQALYMWRGYTVDEIADQLVGNDNDIGKGCNMMQQFGSKKLNLAQISSPLATQVIQAAGVGYSFRVAKEDRAAVVFFGDGSAQKGDVHTGMNFSAVLKAQTMFVCRNNGYGISTPAQEEYVSDSIAIRGLGYGIPAIKVDGNDVMAVYLSTKFAREYMMKHKKPFLLEFMTFRRWHHSTSDDSSFYRTDETVKSWEELNDPVKRMLAFLKKSGIKEYSEKELKDLRKLYRNDVIRALKKASEVPLSKLDNLFKHVYDKPSWLQIEQAEKLKNHMEKYSSYYPSYPKHLK